MRRADLLKRSFNILDIALEDSHGQWLHRWNAKDAVAWAKRAGADGVNMMIINEWGQAYYRSKVMPEHPQLDGTDRLAELLKVAHAEDLVVLGMWGPAANPIVCQEHPDWTHIRADGTPYKWGHAHLAPCEVACLRSPYGKIVLDTLKDLFTRFAIDGVCFDFLMRDPCFCTTCRLAVDTELGLSMDRFDQWSLTDRATYDAWLKGFYSDFIRACTRMADRFGRILIGFSGGEAHYFFCEPHTGGHINLRDKGFLIRQEASIARTTDRQMVLCTPYAHQYAIGLPKPPAHMRQEFRQITVSGDMRLWPVVWDWELVNDPSGLDALHTVFGEATTLSRWMNRSRSLPHIALLNSRETIRHDNGHARLHADGMKGCYDVLSRAHHPVDLIDSAALTPAALKSVRLLVLSNVACLSDEQAAAIRNYVRRGGNLVATYQSSLYDELGRTRYDFALSDLFGSHLVSQMDEPWSYIGLPKGSALSAGLRPGTPLLHGDCAGTREHIAEKRDGRSDRAGDAPAYPYAQSIVEPFGTARPLAEIHATTKRYGTYFFKDETPAPPGHSTGHPAVVVNRYGKGTVYYIAGQPDRVFYRLGHPDHERFLLNLMTLAAGEPPVQLVGPTTVEATYFVKGNATLVHLLNHTYDQIYPVQAGTMGPYGDFSRETFRAIGDIIPVAGLRLRLTLPGRKPTVTDALTGKPHPVTGKAGHWEIRLPQLKEYRAILIRRTK